MFSTQTAVNRNPVCVTNDGRLFLGSSKCVFDVNMFHRNIEYLVIDLPDSSDVDVTRYFSIVSSFVEHALASPNNRVLIHCSAGISRCSTFILAFLMTRCIALRAAFALVRRAYSYANPNIGFWKQLIEFEKQLFNGASSVHIVDLDYGEVPDVLLISQNELIKSVDDAMKIHIYE